MVESPNRAEWGGLELQSGRTGADRRTCRNENGSSDMVRRSQPTGVISDPRGYYHPDGGRSWRTHGGGLRPTLHFCVSSCLFGPPRVRRRRSRTMHPAVNPPQGASSPRGLRYTERPRIGVPREPPSFANGDAGHGCGSTSRSRRPGAHAATRRFDAGSDAAGYRGLWRVVAPRGSLRSRAARREAAARLSPSGRGSRAWRSGRRGSRPGGSGGTACRPARGPRRSGAYRCS